MRRRLAGFCFALLLAAPGGAAAGASNVYFGDLHLHTSWSPDAALFGNRNAGPDTAYRYAKGLPVAHPFHGAKVRIGTPLDFMAVTDHAEFMGVIPMILEGDPRVAHTDTARHVAKLVAEGRGQDVFNLIIQQVFSGDVDPGLVSPEVSGSVWREITAAAERHYQPGRFTTLLAWEWSSMPRQANLHRVVVVREGAEVGDRFVPYSSLTSNRPEDLWKFFESTSERTGAHFVAIPHNSNISRGLMFRDVDLDEEPFDAEYARRRARWEPIVEVTQVKGDSETHPILSPNDEFADYEPFGENMPGPPGVDPPPAEESRSGSYIRSALRLGLEVEARIGVNPYAFGLIGSTDSHTGLASAEEDNYYGKWARQSTPAAKLGDAAQGQLDGFSMGAAGLTAVWANENTREAIFDALQRREAYATTGPRIGVRFFGGWSFGPGDAQDPDPAGPGYAKGVPMGGELSAADADGRTPRFLVHAAKDPVGANLDRIQVVKGWLDAGGSTHERVYDVALSGGREAGPDGKVPPVGNTVDLAAASYANSIGAGELATLWQDPDFDASQPAFYYARVIEIPTPRHTLYDAVALGVEHPQQNPPVIQERAYTSPIWYRP